MSWRLALVFDVVFVAVPVLFRSDEKLVVDSDDD